MYEMRLKQRKEIMQKKWFSYALLLTAMFLYSQGTSMIKNNMGYSTAAILLSFILHTRSVGDLAERIFKIKYSGIANIAMLAALSVISVICYFISLNIFIIVLLNIVAIAIYIVIALIYSKLKTGDN